MILSDGEIRAALEAGTLIVDPSPDADRYGTTSVDLRLDDKFLQWDLEALREQFGEVPTIDIGNYDFSSLAKAYLRPAPVSDDGCATLHPRQFLPGQTLETVGFPHGGALAGRVEGKSSLARLGLSVHFAPTLHAGWRGHITLELHNVGTAPLRLRPDAPICQLLVEPVRGAPTGTMDDTRFQDQESPRGW